MGIELGFLDYSLGLRPVVLRHEFTVRDYRYSLAYVQVLGIAYGCKSVRVGDLKVLLGRNANVSVYVLCSWGLMARVGRGQKNMAAYRITKKGEEFVHVLQACWEREQEKIRLELNAAKKSGTLSGFLNLKKIKGKGSESELSDAV